MNMHTYIDSQICGIAIFSDLELPTALIPACALLSFLRTFFLLCSVIFSPSPTEQQYWHCRRRLLLRVMMLLLVLPQNEIIPGC